MLPANRNLTCYAGDTFPVYCVAKKAGEPIDIASYTFTGQARLTHEDPSPFDFIATKLGVTTTGLVRFHLTAAQTGSMNQTDSNKDFKYDFQAEYVDETGLDIVQTLLYGTLTVMPQVTRAAAP